MAMLMPENWIGWRLISVVPTGLMSVRGLTSLTVELTSCLKMAWPTMVLAAALARAGTTFLREAAASAR